MIEQEDSESDEPSEGEESEERKDSDDSMNSDFLNRSLDENTEQVINKDNFLKFVSSQINVLDTVDKNERSFKLVAEKMIQ